VLLISTSAFAAGQVFSAGFPGGSVFISETPCTNKTIMAQVDPKLRPEIKSALISDHGQKHSACWIANKEDETVVVVDEDGRQIEVPVEDFSLDIRVSSNIHYGKVIGIETFFSYRGCNKSNPCHPAGVAGAMIIERDTDKVYRITVRTESGVVQYYDVWAIGDLRVDDNVRIENNVLFRISNIQG
jgi:hypothetical protein